MTYDLIALVQEEPHLGILVDDLVRAGEGLRVSVTGSGALIQLHDDEGNPVVSVLEPRRVVVAGEAERLLGPEVAAGVTVPYWWVEARAPEYGAAMPALVHRFADALVGRLGGVVWPVQAGESP